MGTLSILAALGTAWVVLWLEASWPDEIYLRIGEPAVRGRDLDDLTKREILRFYDTPGSEPREYEVEDELGFGCMSGDPSILSIRLHHPWTDSPSAEFLAQTLGVPLEAGQFSFIGHRDEIVQAAGARWIRLRHASPLR